MDDSKLAHISRFIYCFLRSFTFSDSSFKKVRSIFDQLKTTIQSDSWSILKQLIELVHLKLKQYHKDSMDFTLMAHTCLRVMKIVREEAIKFLWGPNADFEENSTNRLFASGDESYLSVPKADILDAVLSSLDEFLLDVKACSKNISDQSLDLIHSDELILTRGFSQATFRFLKRAAEKKRVFKVIVCESYPENSGHKFAEDLSKEGVNVILVPDSHVFALMSRVNKVVIGCKTVYPDGSLVAHVGTQSILLAANHFSVPTYVCVPQYKLSPIPARTSAGSPPFTILPASDSMGMPPDWLDSPDLILSSTDQLLISGGLVNRTPSDGPVVWVPRWEHVPSGLVSLFLTNLGSHAPSYLYALGRELFHPSDIEMVI